MSDTNAAVRAILTPEAVRERAHELLALGLDGRLDHWRVDLDRLPAAADLVAQVTRAAYPDLAVPFHARWRHFVVGGQDLWAEIAGRAKWPVPESHSRAAAEFDLAIVSVLLDAGAGPTWRYSDGPTGRVLSRSEGLAVASLRLFESGALSVDPTEPLRVDAFKLERLDAGILAQAFQVSPENPLIGLEDRAALLRRLGQALAANEKLFVRGATPRPGELFGALADGARGGAVEARDILIALLEGLGPIWPGRERLGGVGLGDTWRHPAIRRADATDGLVPFHKLSQWLAYSLIEPIERAGIEVTGVDALTGLPEYRNGGLFMDAGVLALRDATQADAQHEVGSLLVVEWRALTVALLDRIAPLVRERLGVAAETFPPAKVLEGGTWAAGRRLARERRADGGPPLKVVSDGTVF
jgi:hypothetical protein